MKLVGSHQILCLLSNLSIFGRKKLRTHRRIQNIQQHGTQSLILASIRIIAHQMAHQCLRYGGVDAVHGHVISVIGGPAQSQLGHIAGSDHHATGLVGDIHQYLGPLPGLAVFVGHIMIFLAVTDI